MSDLPHIFHVGEHVQCNMDQVLYAGTIEEVHKDHIIVDIPGISGHCWFEAGLNCRLCCLFFYKIQFSSFIL